MNFVTFTQMNNEKIIININDIVFIKKSENHIEYTVVHVRLNDKTNTYWIVKESFEEIELLLKSNSILKKEVNW